MKKFIIICLTFILLITSNGTLGSASREVNTDVIDERWGKPTFVYGESLDRQQVLETQKALNIKDPSTVNSVKVTYDDLLNYIGGDSNNRANMISSVLVKKESENSGISVVIKTSKNITTVTEKQYENAAITAGVTDATIMVTAIRPVTGESALTGIYKAFEANGEKLDRDRMKVAQDELEVVSRINQDNKGKENYKEGQLNNIIIDIKNNLSNIGNNNNKKNSLSLEEVKKVVNDAIKKNNLQNVITEEQKQKLINLFKKYSNTDAINSKEVKQQLKDLSSKVVSGAKDVYNKAEESGLLDRIAKFFADLFQSIMNLFN